MAAIAAAAPSSTPSAPSAASEGPAVTEVIVFDVGPNMDKFLELTKRAGSIAQKYGSTGKARFWRAAYAGREAGAVIVTVEYPSLVSMAQSVSKVQPSPEWQQLVADGQASSIKPISQSVVVEVKAGS